MITALNAVSAATGIASAAGAQANLSSSAGGAAAGAPFADLMTDAVGQVDQLEQQADTAVTGLMTGNGVDVHTAMIASEKASMRAGASTSLRSRKLIA
jgi:flagellar hook-basal body complex protein FliE